MKNIAILVLIFVFGVFLIKWFWAWTIPEIFPGAVQQNLIAAKISWWTALKLSILFSLTAAVSRVSKK
ncbi:MAG: hypothetical protein COT17_07860 [Elusimicrobia bacterium CG08_land_8_20_14_0_20_51_18]|nr:MAG: hypothetical protein COT17_07860 [Elusimicrobia bacterium CG08_land_8_20_14_0_20_51_18]